MANLPHIVFAAFLVVLGVLVLKYGDMPVGGKGGITLQLLSWPKSRIKIIKWFVGLLLILFGISVLWP